MTTDLGTDFIDQYLGITNLLKKRFMRKPNVSEATDEFCNLALQCQLSEQPSFAGLCYLGAARCEGSIGNSTGEAEYLLFSARQFMNAELKLKSLKCLSPARENLEAAISCYMHVSCRYPEVSPLRASLSLELADFLERLGFLREAIEHYKSSMQYLPENISHKVNCLQQIGHLQIVIGNYVDALHTHDSILEAGKSYHNWRVNKESEINTLLLIVLTSPAQKAMTPNLKKMLDTYTVDISTCPIEPQGVNMDCQLFINIQSLLVACQINDLDGLLSLQTELKKHLTIDQQDVLANIIKKIEKSL